MSIINKLWLPVLICLSAITICQGQVSGFLGKRALLTYGARLHYNNSLTNEIQSSNHVQSAAISLTHELSFGYITGKKTIMGIEGSTGNFVYSYYPNDLYITPLENVSLNILNYGVFITGYGGNNGPSAPLGGFFKFKVFKQRLSPQFENHNNDVFLKAIGMQQHYDNLALGLCYGTSRMIKNKVFLSFSAEADFNTGLLGLFFVDDIDTKAGDLQTQMFWHNILQFKLAAGGFLF